MRARKQELGLGRAEVFVPQSYRWGQEGEVDWCEAWVEMEGEGQKVYLCCLRSMASGGGDAMSGRTVELQPSPIRE